MLPSIQNLTDKFKNVVFDMDEVEYQDNSTLIELWPFLGNQDSNSDVRDKFKILRNE